MVKTWNEMLSDLPDSSTNNSRSIIRALARKFDKQPSEALAHKIEDLTGFGADFLSADHGNGPAGYVEN